MFSRSKRFVERPVGCGADAAYNPKDIAKPVGGVIPKVDRFTELKHANSIKSDTESVYSDKSSQIFRTPKAVRRLIVNSIRKKDHREDDSTQGLSEALMKEYLDAKNVEIRNKNETITEYENQMRELREKIGFLYRELRKLSKCCHDISGNDVDVSQINVSELSEHVQQCLFDESCDSCRSATSLVERFEAIKAENQMLHDEIDLLKSLETRLIDLEVEFKVLKEEHDLVETILTEFEAKCSNDVDNDCMKKSVLAKVNFIIEEFVKKRKDVSILKLALAHLECELGSLLNINVDNAEIVHVDLQNDNVKLFEFKNVELGNAEEGLSIDFVVSNVIRSHKTIIKQLNQQLEEQVSQIQLLIKNIVMIQSHHTLALDANESIRHEYKVEIDALRAKHNEEIALMEKQHNDHLEAERNKYSEKIQEGEKSHRLEMARKERDCSLKINQIEETSAEKLKLCEIQFEERYDELQSYADSQIHKEKELTQKELEECQKHAVSQSMYYMHQTTEWKKLIEASDQNAKHYSDEAQALRIHYDEKQCCLEKTETQLKEVERRAEDQKSAYEKRIGELQREIDRINNDKMKFAVTLETTRQAVEVLSARLRNSDDDVDKFKTKLDDAVSLNAKYETEISKLKEEFKNFKKEYNDLLTCIVESKAALDKNHQSILKENSDLIESLSLLELDMTANINTLKIDLCYDIEQFKEHSQRTIDQLQFKVDEEHSKYLNMKAQCDTAFEKIGDCQQLLSIAEVQMENKDQELNELSTENVRLSGTLMALEQEKNELKLLLGEFVKLSKEKDRKLHHHLKKIEEHEMTIANYEDNIRKLNQLLEATEFIVKEADNDINNYKDDIEKLTADLDALHAKHSEELTGRDESLKVLRNENDAIRQKCQLLDTKISEINHEDHQELVKELRDCLKQKDEEINRLNTRLSDAEIHLATCDLETVRKHCKNLEMDLEEMTDKYTNLLGHQNNKQKIKHVIDLKMQNNTLKEENEKLTFTVEKHISLIEKLKKELAEANKIHSPLAHRKQFMLVSSSGKENIAARFSQSPNRLGSPKSNSERALTPLKDSNR
ncbi:uncharacterized protein LOC143919035 [Arctopsyche grandis]|uniref:uncharacterized protein LOC143919035 n=1 Tax=Arctopsyche grandis TaxID=121162 RepID=UPI00406D9833